MPAALVFGASGQLGRPLLARLRAAGWEVVAVSREARREPGTCWIQGELGLLGAVPGRFDVVFSCGPLDRFAAWYATHGAGIPRVVAFGSTSAEVKQRSGDPASATWRRAWPGGRRWCSLPRAAWVPRPPCSGRRWSTARAPTAR